LVQMRIAMSKRYNIVWGEFKFWLDVEEECYKLSMWFTLDGELKRVAEAYPNVQSIKDKYDDETYNRERVIEYLDKANKRGTT